MTTTIRLDTNAVASLFKTEESRLELQKAVVAEICKRMFDRYVAKDLLRAMEAQFDVHKNELTRMFQEDTAFKVSLEDRVTKMIADVQTQRYSKAVASVKLTPEIQAALVEKAKEISSQFVKDAAIQGDQLIQEAVKRSVERIQGPSDKYIDIQVNNRIEKWTNEEIDRRVNDRLKRALENH